MDVNGTLADVFEKAEQAFNDKLPFTLYRHPESHLVKGVFQKNNNLFYSRDYCESGFIFAPFDNENLPILFPKGQSIHCNGEFLENLNVDFEKDTLTESNSETSKAKHIALVKDGIKFLECNNFKKVVLSRKKTIKLRKIEVFETFKKLLVNYKNAFVYCWFHPKVGLWLGATPETLLRMKNDTFYTVALAGTQVYDKDTNTLVKASEFKGVNWQAKEVAEQQYVTDFIVEQLNIDVKVSKPYTIKAGNLLHLQTDISGELTQQLTLKKIIKLLHPTPAVCGVPKQEAKDFILRNESYNRQFYTGFLGELNLNKTSNLFVNLRCMQILKNRVEIYIGGGITEDSIPQSEWEETVAKSKVLLNILQ